jgi:hypothetical protein
VQVQTVIAATPRLPDTPTLDDGGVYASRSQCRRGSQSGRTSADDDDIVHSPRLLLTALYAAQVASMQTHNADFTVSKRVSNQQTVISAGNGGPGRPSCRVDLGLIVAMTVRWR